MKLKNTSSHIIVIITFSALFFTSGIGLLDIYSLDEAKNVEAAREMLVNNDLIVPTFNGNLRTDKPPLHYYFMITSFKIFGVNAYAARFFSAIMGILTVLIVFIFTKRNITYEVGFYAALLLMTSLHFNIQMHMAVPDPYLIFILTFCGFAFYEFYENKKKIYWWLFYIFIGLGILAKGPIAIVLPGMSIFLYLLLKGDFNWKNILRINPFFGGIIALAIAIPWFYAVHQATDGAFTEGFFFKHNLGRFSNKMEGHGGVFLITLGFVLLGTLPYAFFLFRIKTLKKIIKKNTFNLFSVCYAFSIIGFFLLSSTRLPNYTVPAYPWLFILISGIIFKMRPEKVKPYLIATIIFSVLLPIGAIIGLKNDKTIPHLYYLGFFFIILTIGAILAYLKRKEQKDWLRYLITSWGLIIVLFFYFLYPKIDVNNPVAKSRGLIHYSENIIAYKKFNSAFVFELKKEIPVLKTSEELEKYIKNHPEGGKIITRTKYIEDLEKLNLKEVYRARDIFENPTTLILEF